MIDFSHSLSLFIGICYIFLTHCGSILHLFLSLSRYVRSSLLFVLVCYICINLCRDMLHLHQSHSLCIRCVMLFWSVLLSVTIWCVRIFKSTLLFVAMLDLFLFLRHSLLDLPYSLSCNVRSACLSLSVSFLYEWTKPSPHPSAKRNKSLRFFLSFFYLFISLFINKSNLVDWALIFLTLISNTLLDIL